MLLPPFLTLQDAWRIHSPGAPTAAALPPPRTHKHPQHPGKLGRGSAVPEPGKGRRSHGEPWAEGARKWDWGDLLYFALGKSLQ